MRSEDATSLFANQPAVLPTYLVAARVVARKGFSPLLRAGDGIDHYYKLRLQFFFAVATAFTRPLGGTRGRK